MYLEYNASSFLREKESTSFLLICELDLEDLDCSRLQLAAAQPTIYP